jgi:hypothetical protein
MFSIVPEREAFFSTNSTEGDVKTQAQQSMIQQRRHASALPSRVAKRVASSFCVAVPAGLSIVSGKVHAGMSRLLNTRSASCHVIGSDGFRSEGVNWKHRNIIRGGIPEVAGG